jgi:hypothetical protein
MRPEQNIVVFFLESESGQWLVVKAQKADKCGGTGTILVHGHGSVDATTPTLNQLIIGILTLAKLPNKSPFATTNWSTIYRSPVPPFITQSFSIQSLFVALFISGYFLFPTITLTLSVLSLLSLDLTIKAELLQFITELLLGNSKVFSSSLARRLVSGSFYFEQNQYSGSASDNRNPEAEGDLEELGNGGFEELGDGDFEDQGDGGLIEPGNGDFEDPEDGEVDMAYP